MIHANPDGHTRSSIMPWNKVLSLSSVMLLHINSHFSEAMVSGWRNIRPGLNSRDSLAFTLSHPSGGVGLIKPTLWPVHTLVMTQRQRREGSVTGSDNVRPCTSHRPHEAKNYVLLMYKTKAPTCCSNISLHFHYWTKLSENSNSKLIF